MGKKKQARRLRSISAQNHGARFLEVPTPLLVKIGDARGTAMAIHLHAKGVTVCADFAAAGLLRHGNDAGERTGLCPYLAAETQASPAVNAPRPASIRLR